MIRMRHWPISCQLGDKKQKKDQSLLPREISRSGVAQSGGKSAIFISLFVPINILSVLISRCIIFLTKEMPRKYGKTMAASGHLAQSTRDSLGTSVSPNRDCPHAEEHKTHTRPRSCMSVHKECVFRRSKSCAFAKMQHIQQNKMTNNLRVFVLHPGITPLRNDPEWFKITRFYPAMVVTWGEYPVQCKNP